MPGATALFAHHSPSATRLIKLQHFLQQQPLPPTLLQYYSNCRQDPIAADDDDNATARFHRQHIPF